MINRRQRVHTLQNDCVTLVYVYTLAGGWLCHDRLFDQTQESAGTLGALTPYYSLAASSAFRDIHTEGFQAQLVETSKSLMNHTVTAYVSLAVLQRGIYSDIHRKGMFYFIPAGYCQ